MKDVVAALYALNTPVIAIPDFDIFDDSAKLKNLASAFGIEWSLISDNLNKILACLNADNGKIRNMIKKNGHTVLEGEAPSAYRDINGIFRKTGLFVVPVGEIESFDKTINKDKKEWVYDILKRGNLNTEPSLETARAFIKAVVEYKPRSLGKESPTGNG